MPIARDFHESWLSLNRFVGRQRDVLFDKAISETEADIGRRQDGILESHVCVAQDNIPCTGDFIRIFLECQTFEPEVSIEGSARKRAPYTVALAW